MLYPGNPPLAETWTAPFQQASVMTWVLSRAGNKMVIQNICIVVGKWSLKVITIFPSTPHIQIEYPLIETAWSYLHGGENSYSMTMFPRKK